MVDVISSKVSDFVNGDHTLEVGGKKKRTTQNPNARKKFARSALQADEGVEVDVDAAVEGAGGVDELQVGVLHGADVIAGDLG